MSLAEIRNIADYVRGILWRLIKLLYGIVGAGREWKKVIEAWMLSPEGGGLQHVPGIRKLFTRRNCDCRLMLIVIKVTDGILIGRDIAYIREFVARTKKTIHPRNFYHQRAISL